MTLVEIPIKNRNSCPMVSHSPQPGNWMMVSQEVGQQHSSCWSGGSEMLFQVSSDAHRPIGWICSLMAERI